MDVKNTADLLRTIRGKMAAVGLKIVVADTGEPDTLRLRFEGTKSVLNASLFEVPINLYPIKKGDRFLAFRLLGSGSAQRWGLLQKLNGTAVNMATMQGPNSLKIDGVDKVYTAADLVIIPGLLAGDRVSVAPTWDGTQVKYVILNKH